MYALLLVASLLGQVVPPQDVMAPDSLVVSGGSGGGTTGGGGNPNYPLLAPTGSAAAPSYSFTANPNSGMSQSSGNPNASVTFYVEGGLALALDPNLLATFGGSVVVPAASSFNWVGRSALSSSADGRILLAFSNGTSINGAILDWGVTGSVSAPRMQAQAAPPGWVLTNTNGAGTAYTIGGNFLGLQLGAPATTSLIAGGPAFALATGTGTPTGYGYGFSDTTHTAIYTNSLPAMIFDNVQNANILGNLNVVGAVTAGALAQNTNIVLNPNTLYYGWLGRAQLHSQSTDGWMYSTRSDGTTPTNGTGLCFASNGSACVGLGNTVNRVRLQTAAGVGINMESSGHVCTTTPCGFTDGTTLNGFFNDPSAMVHVSSGSALSETWDSSGNANHIKGNEIVQNGNQYIFGTDTGLARYAAGVMRPTNAAAGNGAVIGDQFFSPQTGNFSPAVADSGVYYTNTGAAGSITGTLPACVMGRVYGFVDTAAFTIIVATTGADTITIPGVTGVTKTQVTSPAVGAGALVLYCVAAGVWQPMAAQTGTWTSN